MFGSSSPQPVYQADPLPEPVLDPAPPEIRLPQHILELVLQWLILLLGLWTAAFAIPGIHLSGLRSAIEVALVIFVVMTYLKPVIDDLLLLYAVLTLGLFRLVIDASFLYSISWIATRAAEVGWLSERVGTIRFEVDDLGAALLGAVVIAVVRFGVGTVVSPRRLAAFFFPAGETPSLELSNEDAALPPAA